MWGQFGEWCESKTLNDTQRDEEYEDIEFMFIVTSRNYHLDLEVST